MIDTKNNPYILDIPAGADASYSISAHYKKLTGGAWLTPVCSFCPNPTITLLTWKPEGAGLRFATKTPKGVTRVFFFPVCALCAGRDQVELELKWKATEALFTNSPTEAPGFGLYH